MHSNNWLGGHCLEAFIRDFTCCMHESEIDERVPGMVQAWVAKKTRKRNVLQVFLMSHFINIKEIIGKDTYRKRFFYQLIASLTTPTKYSGKMVKCFSLRIPHRPPVGFSWVLQAVACQGGI